MEATDDNLLEKYGIPIEHLDFNYVANCTDGNELEKILQILKSGEEGYYPDLIQATEKRLILIKPKSRYLRKPSPMLYKESLSQEETKQITCDLNEWIDNMLINDKKLEKHKINSNRNDIPIRKCEEIKIDGNKKKTKKRLSSTDYSSWDKYDADTEILKMDLEEEKLKKSLTLTTKNTNRKTVKFKENLTEIEAEHQAIHEKNKGNEFYRNHDYQQALECYTNSLRYKRTIVALLNRALIYFKLKQFKKCIKDCDEALEFEANNIKAIIRKTQALIELNEKSVAYKTIQKALQIDCNNRFVQELLQQLRKDLRIIETNSKRYQINDCKDEIIPIAGTSQMSPPHFITSTTSRTIIEKQTTLHVINVDTTENDEDCTINHLQHIYEDHSKVDEKAGGELCLQQNSIIIENLHSPYGFLKAWLSASSDSSLEELAMILKILIDTNRIIDVIGCKLDNSMFTNLLNCLCQHFTVIDQIERLSSILLNIIQLPRFNIITLLLTDNDRINLRRLIEFLKQHDKHLVVDVLLNQFNL